MSKRVPPITLNSYKINFQNPVTPHTAVSRQREAGIYSIKRASVAGNQFYRDPNGNLQSHLPPWFSALQLHPPTGNHSRGIDPSTVFKPPTGFSSGSSSPSGSRPAAGGLSRISLPAGGGSTAATSDVSQWSADETDPTSVPLPTRHISTMPRGHARRLARSLYHKRRILRAPTISYPEDEIRRRFYEEHPFELFRGTPLAEDGEQGVRENVRNWERGVPPEESQTEGEVTAESAIRHALYLHINQNLPLSVAYSTAVHAFRLQRAREERAAREREFAAHGPADTAAPGADRSVTVDKNKALQEFFKARPRPATKKFLEWEDREVEEGREAERERREELDARRAQSEQMSQFDAAGSKPGDAQDRMMVVVHGADRMAVDAVGRRDAMFTPCRGRLTLPVRAPNLRLVTDTTLHSLLDRLEEHFDTGTTVKRLVVDNTAVTWEGVAFAVRVLTRVRGSSLKWLSMSMCPNLVLPAEPEKIIEEYFVDGEANVDAVGMVRGWKNEAERTFFGGKQPRAGYGIHYIGKTLSDVADGNDHPRILPLLPSRIDTCRDYFTVRPLLLLSAFSTRTASSHPSFTAPDLVVPRFHSLTSRMSTGGATRKSVSPPSAPEDVDLVVEMGVNGCETESAGVVGEDDKDSSNETFEDALMMMDEDQVDDRSTDGDLGARDKGKKVVRDWNMEEIQTRRPRTFLLPPEILQQILREYSAVVLVEREISVLSKVTDMNPETYVRHRAVVRLSNSDLYSCLSVNRTWSRAAAAVLYEVLDAPLILATSTPSRLTDPWNALVSVVGKSSEQARNRNKGLQGSQPVRPQTHLPYASFVRYVNLGGVPPRFTPGLPVPRRPPPPIFLPPAAGAQTRLGPALSATRSKRERDAAAAANTKVDDKAAEEAYSYHTRFLKAVGPSLTSITAAGCVIEGKIFDSLIPCSPWTFLYSLDLTLARPVHSLRRSRAQPALLSLAALPELAPNLRALRVRGCRCIAATVVETCEALKRTLDHLEIGSESGPVRRDQDAGAMGIHAGALQGVQVGQGQAPQNAQALPTQLPLLPAGNPGPGLVAPGGGNAPLIVPQLPAQPIQQNQNSRRGSQIPQPLAGEHFTHRDLERIAFALGPTLRHLSLSGDHLLRTVATLPSSKFSERFVKLIGLDIRGGEIELDDVLVGMVVGMVPGDPPAPIQQATPMNAGNNSQGAAVDVDIIPPPHPDGRLSALSISGRLRGPDSLRFLAPYTNRLVSLRLETRLPTMTPAYRRAHVEAIRFLLSSAPGLQRLAMLSHDRFLGKDLRRMFEGVRNLKELEVPESTMLQLNVLFQVPGTGHMGMSVGLYRYPRADESFLAHLSDTCGDTLRTLRIALAGERDTNDRAMDEEQDEDGPGDDGDDGDGPGNDDEVAIGQNLPLPQDLGNNPNAALLISNVLGQIAGGAMGGFGAGQNNQSENLEVDGLAEDGGQSNGQSAGGQHELTGNEILSQSGDSSDNTGEPSGVDTTVADIGSSSLQADDEAEDEVEQTDEDSHGAVTVNFADMVFDIEIQTGGSNDAVTSTEAPSVSPELNTTEDSAHSDAMEGIEGEASDAGESSLGKRKDRDDDYENHASVGDDNRKRPRQTVAGEGSSSSLPNEPQSLTSSNGTVLISSSSGDAVSSSAGPHTTSTEATSTSGAQSSNMALLGSLLGLMLVETIGQALGAITGTGSGSSSGGANSGHSSSIGSQSESSGSSTGGGSSDGAPANTLTSSVASSSASAPPVLPSQSSSSALTNAENGSGATAENSGGGGINSGSMVPQSIMDLMSAFGQAMFGGPGLGNFMNGSGNSAGLGSSSSAGGSVILPLSSANFGSFMSNGAGQSSASSFAGTSSSGTGGTQSQSSQTTEVDISSSTPSRNRARLGDLTVSRIRRIPGMFRNLSRLSIDVVEEEAVQRMRGLYRGRPDEAVFAGNEAVIVGRNAVERLIGLE
ncbi:hypothetical protein HDU93_006381 [Gonapodya sp. JEL0774]|nr:hypothetical protein HDU93_006381 [Gonapodya sp. JEL0774]